jgi:predicted enzyme related to lactoylglutathione lyase
MAGLVIYAKDLARMTAFYAGVTGRSVSFSGEGYCALDDDLILQQIPEALASSIEIDDPPARREAAPLKGVFGVADLAAARAAAALLGGGIDPADREWQFEELIVCDGHDPEGNVIQFRTEGRGR